MRIVAAVRIADLMTDQVVSASAHATLAEVGELMRDRNVGSVVILDEGSRPAALMVQHHIRRLPVVHGAELAGIVTIDDIAVRAGDLQLAQQMTAEVAKSALPEFFFHQRGG